MRRHLTWAALAAVMLAAPAVQAQEQASLGLGVGLVRPSDVDSTFWVTANYRFRVTDRLSVEPEVGYWKKGEDVPGFSASVEDLNFGANAILEFAGDGDGLQPWVGAGLGLHRLKGVVGLGNVDVDETETELGVHLLGGLDFDLSETIGAFAAARYDFVSELNQFKLYGGLRYKF